MRSESKTVVPKFEVIVKHEISDERVRCLLVGAFEGGSNYWYMIERHDYGPLGKKVLDTCVDEALRDEYKRMDHYLLPFVPGCALVISDKESEDEPKPEYRLDRDSMRKALVLMQEKYPHHFRDFIEENDDATTADVFLQICLFGGVIYG